jgi:UDP-N-acetylglucosamine pyrophosphorylase
MGRRALSKQERLLNKRAQRERNVQASIKKRERDRARMQNLRRKKIAETTSHNNQRLDSNTDANTSQSMIIEDVQQDRQSGNCLYSLSNI